MHKRIIVVFACMVLAFGLVACSQPKEEGPDYADDEAMEVIAKGLEKRSDVIDAQEPATDNASQKANYKEAVQAEIDADKGLKDRQFEDSKLQEKVIAYLNSLDDSLEVLENNSISSADFYTKWDKVYGERTSLLKEFVDDYDLTVGEKYQDVLDELISSGKAAMEKRNADEAINALVSAATWEKTDDGYGNFTYTATIENTSDMAFEDVGITLAFYDNKGVKASEGYASTQSWAKGEKVRFEAYGDIDAAQIKASVDYYTVAE